MDMIIAFGTFFALLMGVSVILRVCRVLFKIVNGGFDRLEEMIERR